MSVLEKTVTAPSTMQHSTTNIPPDIKLSTSSPGDQTIPVLTSLWEIQHTETNIKLAKKLI